MNKFLLFAAACLTALQVSSQSCLPNDVPDRLFQDINNDGIDGDTAHAIFVSTQGSDTATGGITDPVLTIEYAIQLAAAAGKDVYVAAGTYNVSATLQLVSGVNLYGLYSGTPAWNRSNANTTIINGPAQAVSASNISVPTGLEGFEIRAAAATAAGGSSYGIIINGGTAPTILRYNTIKAGSGNLGSIGTNGQAGANGGDGGNGGSGSCDGSTAGAGGAAGASPCGQTGGSGGSGGPEGNHAGQAGGTGAGGTTGGSGGSGGDPGGTGADGNIGTGGSSGTNGSAAITGSISGTGEFTPGDGGTGTDGTHGNGGGGGGGGGGQGCTLCNDGSGNGGGGGGGGGCAGTAGSGGGGGGGSFGVIVNNALALIDKNNIMTAQGGNGGNGGSGGQPGVGGSGGSGSSSCDDEVGGGGHGGRGGDGGASGSGAGGAGGPSIALYMAGSYVVTGDSNSYFTGNAGAGGAGGSNLTIGNAPAGPNGITANVIGSFSPLPLDTPAICILDTNIQEPASGNATVTFTVVLDRPSGHPVSVQYAAASGTATTGADFTAASGTLTFAPDEMIKTIEVTVLSDLITEGDETFNLNLYIPTGATIAHTPGVCTIFDTPTGIDELTSQKNNYVLMQNIPNPVSDNARISFSLPVRKQIQLQLLSINGEVLQTITAGTFDAGLQQVNLDCSNLASGIYFYSLTANDVTLIKKMSVIH